VASADSKVTVKIEGDADGLQRELKKADKGLAGLGASTKGLLAAGAFAGITAGALEFGQVALGEADRVGDATARMQLSLGDLSESLIDTADDFTDLGLSKQDVLEIEARFAEVATALGVPKDAIAELADEVATTAKAIELLGGADAATNVDLITKAAGGSIKAYKELGILVDENVVLQQALKDTGKPTTDMLTDQEIATARLNVVMELLKPKLDEVAGSEGDVEVKTAAIQAKFETLQGQIGQAIEGPLEDFLDWMIHGIEGLGLLGDAIDGVKIDLSEMAGPLGEAIRGLKVLLELAGLVQEKGGNFVPKGSGLTGPPGGGRSGGSSGPTVNPNTGFVTSSVVVNVAPSGGADLERAVVTALRDHVRRNGTPV